MPFENTLKQYSQVHEPNVHNMDLVKKFRVSYKTAENISSLKVLAPEDQNFATSVGYLGLGVASLGRSTEVRGLRDCQTVIEFKN